jgi:hypothetical protein
MAIIESSDHIEQHKLNDCRIKLWRNMKSWHISSSSSQPVKFCETILLCMLVRPMIQQFKEFHKNTKLFRDYYLVSTLSKHSFKIGYFSRFSYLTEQLLFVIMFGKHFNRNYFNEFHSKDFEFFLITFLVSRMSC